MPDKNISNNIKPEPALVKVEPTASFNVDLSIKTKIDPPLYSPVIVHFRPGANWATNNYGFDWMRIGDSGIWSDNKGQDIANDNNVKCEDYYLRLMGKYFQRGTTTPADNANQWVLMDDKRTMCEFKPDLESYKNLIRSSFPIAYTISWRTLTKKSDIRFDSSITDEKLKDEITRCNYTYYCPILFIRQGQTANLKLRIYKYPTGEVPIGMELEEYIPAGTIAPSPPNFTFTGVSSTTFPADTAEVTIACNNILDDFKYIDAYAIFTNLDTSPGQPPQVRQHCGRLRVHPNNNIRQLKVLHIPIKLISTGLSNTVGALSPTVVSETNRILNYQCLIDQVVSTYDVLTLDNNIPSLDTPPVTLRIRDYKDSSGDLTRISNITWAAFKNDLETKATAARNQLNLAEQNHIVASTSITQAALDAAKANPELHVDRFDEHIKIFIVDADTTEAHSTNVASRYIILFKNGGAETLAHEMMHAMGLYHPFSSAEQFGYQAQQTENLMDYSHVVCDSNGNPTAPSSSTPRLSLWYWQLKTIWKNIDLFDFIAKGRIARRELNPDPPIPMPIAVEQSNEVTIGTDPQLRPFISVPKI